MLRMLWLNIGNRLFTIVPKDFKNNKIKLKDRLRPLSLIFIWSTRSLLSSVSLTVLKLY